MAKDVKSVHLPEGTVEQVLERMRGPGQSVNKLMVDLMFEGIHHRENPPTTSPPNTEEVDAIKAELAELKTANASSTEQMAQMRGEFETHAAALKEEYDDILRAATSTIDSLQTRLQEANKRADDHEQRTMELEQVLLAAEDDKKAAEILLEEMENTKLNADLVQANAELSRVRIELETRTAAVVQLTTNLGAITAEHEQLLATAGTMQRVGYDELLAKAHKTASYMEHAIFLPPAVFGVLHAFNARNPGRSLRRRAVMLLVEAMEDKHSLVVEPGWGADIDAELPILPKLPPKPAH